MSLVPQFVYNFHSSPVSAVSFLQYKGTDYLLSGCDSGTISILNLSTYRTVSSIHSAHKGRILSLHTGCRSYPSNPVVFISHGKDGLIKFFGDSNDDDVSKLSELHTIETDCASFWKFDVFYQEQQMFVCAPDANVAKTLRIYAIGASDTGLKCLESNSNSLEANPTAVKIFSCNSNFYLLVCNEAGKLVVFQLDLKSLELTKACEKSVYTELVTCMDFDCDAKTGICASVTDTLVKFKISIGCEDKMSEDCSIEVLKTVKVTNPGVSSVVIRPDKRIVATGGWDHRVRLFGWKTLKPLAVLAFHDNTVDTVAYSAKCPNQGFFLAAGSSDESISLWNLYN